MQTPTSSPAPRPRARRRRCTPAAQAAPGSAKHPRGPLSRCLAFPRQSPLKRLSPSAPPRAQEGATLRRSSGPEELCSDSPQEQRRASPARPELLTRASQHLSGHRPPGIEPRRPRADGRGRVGLPWGPLPVADDSPQKLRRQETQHSRKDSGQGWPQLIRPLQIFLIKSFRKREHW